MIARAARQPSAQGVGLCVIVFGAILGVATSRAMADGVVGAKKSKVYHTHSDDCSAARNISGENRVSFASEEEAKKEGRRMCKSCAKLDERARKKAAEPSQAERAARSKRPKNVDAEESDSEVPPEGETIEVQVKTVLTGGTLQLENGDKARLFGVIAPQAEQPFADETVRFMEKRLKGRKVQLAPVEGARTRTRRDGLGRTLAFVVLSSGDSDLGGELISEGLAAVDRSVEFVRLDDYLKREDDAAWAGRGIWKKHDGPEGAAKVITGKHTFEYHSPDCPHVVHLIDPATISVNEAKGRRLHPCEYYRNNNGQKD